MLTWSSEAESDVVFQRVVAFLRRQPNLQWLEVTGSVPRGEADEHSDLGFVLVFQPEPSVEERHGWVHALREQATFFYLDYPTFWGRFDTFFIGSQRVTWHTLRPDRLWRAFQAWREQRTLNREKERLLGHELPQGVVLQDSQGWTDEWHEAMAHYPPQRWPLLLAATWRWWQGFLEEMEQAWERGDALWPSYRLLEPTLALAHLLCAINRQCFPGPQRLLGFLRPLPHQPQGLLEYGERLLASSGTLEELTSLYREIYAWLTKQLQEEGVLPSEELQATFYDPLHMPPRSLPPRRLPQEQLGLDFAWSVECTAVRMKAAVQRGDPTAFLLHHRQALDALGRVWRVLHGSSPYRLGFTPRRGLLPLRNGLLPDLYHRLYALSSLPHTLEYLPQKRALWLALQRDLLRVIQREFPECSLREYALSWAARRLQDLGTMGD